MGVLLVRAINLHLWLESKFGKLLRWTQASPYKDSTADDVKKRVLNHLICCKTVTEKPSEIKNEHGSEKVNSSDFFPEISSKLNQQKILVLETFSSISFQIWNPKIPLNLHNIWMKPWKSFTWCSYHFTKCGLQRSSFWNDKRNCHKWDNPWEI